MAILPVGIGAAKPFETTQPSTDSDRLVLTRQLPSRVGITPGATFSDRAWESTKA